MLFAMVCDENLLSVFSSSYRRRSYRLPFGYVSLPALCPSWSGVVSVVTAGRVGHARLVNRGAQLSASSGSNLTCQSTPGAWSTHSPMRSLSGENAATREALPSRCVLSPRKTAA